MNMTYRELAKALLAIENSDTQIEDAWNTIRAIEDKIRLENTINELSDVNSAIYVYLRDLVARYGFIQNRCDPTHSKGVVINFYKEIEPDETYTIECHLFHDYVHVYCVTHNLNASSYFDLASPDMLDSLKSFIELVQSDIETFKSENEKYSGQSTLEWYVFVQDRLKVMTITAYLAFGDVYSFIKQEQK